MAGIVQHVLGDAETNATVLLLRNSQSVNETDLEP